MASSKDYLDFISEQLSELDDITYRAFALEQLKLLATIYSVL